MSKLSIIIPSYDEYENLTILLPKLKEAISKYFISTETNVFIVDSVVENLKTKKLCESFNFIYVNRVPNNNFGDAIRSGIKFVSSEYSSTEWLIIMDSDNSHNPEMFKEFSEIISTDSADIVIASRYISGGKTENSLLLIFLSKVVNLIYKNIFNFKIYDISNNYRLYKFDILKNIKLVENNFEIVEEILIKIRKNQPNVRIKEVPSTFYKREFGKSKRNLFLFFLTYLNSIYKLKKFEK